MGRAQAQSRTAAHAAVTRLMQRLGEARPLFRAVLEKPDPTSERVPMWRGRAVFCAMTHISTSHSGAFSLFEVHALNGPAVSVGSGIGLRPLCICLRPEFCDRPRPRPRPRPTAAKESLHFIKL